MYVFISCFVCEHFVPSFKDQGTLRYCKSSIKPPVGLINFILGPFEGEGGLFNLETMASVLHKELEYKVNKLKYKKVGGHAAQDQNKIRTSSW